MIWLDIWKVCFASYPLLKHNICLNYILTVKQLSRYNYYMKHQQAAPKFFPKKRCIILSVIALLLIVPITVITQPKIADKLSSLINSTSFDRSPGESAFPDIDTANLSPTRQKIISLAKTEFEAQSAGTKFSQGAKEPWCANFVSYIMNQAGAPLKNPHTGDHTNIVLKNDNGALTTVGGNEANRIRVFVNRDK